MIRDERQERGINEKKRGELEERGKDNEGEEDERGEGRRSKRRGVERWGGRE